MKLIKVTGLMKIVSKISPCYERLVKEFVVSISDECNDEGSKDYGKVVVRGKSVNFSPIMINKYMGSTEEPQAKLEKLDDKVCRKIIGDKCNTGERMENSHPGDSL